MPLYKLLMMLKCLGMDADGAICIGVRIGKGLSLSRPLLGRKSKQIESLVEQHAR
jgi:hypothetical protein